MVFKPLDYDANGIEQRHLGLLQLDFLHQRH